MPVVPAPSHAPRVGPQSALLGQRLLQAGQALGRRLAAGLGLVPQAGHLRLLDLLVLLGCPQLADGGAVVVDDVGEHRLAATGLGQVAGPDDVEEGVAGRVHVGPHGDGRHLPLQVGHVRLGGR